MYRKVMMVIGILLLGVVSVFSSTPTASGGRKICHSGLERPGNALL